MAEGARILETVASPPNPAPTTTLLELVAAVADHSETEAEVIATVSHLINSGRIRRVGNFRGADVTTH